MKKNIFRISIAVLFIAVVAACIFACNKEKVVKESAETTEATLPQLYSCQSSINPFDKYAIGIKQYLEKVAILCENPWYEDHLEVFEQDAGKLTYLIQYPTLDKSICEKIDFTYLQALLGTFLFETEFEKILENATKAELHVIANIDDKQLQNAYLEIISICKYDNYYGLITYKAYNWNERRHNCVLWKIHDAMNDPVSAATFSIDWPYEITKFEISCIWIATFRPNDPICQTQAPEVDWIDLD